MKRIIENLTIGAAGLILVAALASAFTGCMFHKTTTVTPGGTNTLGVYIGPVTNVTYTVDEVALAADAMGLTTIIAGGTAAYIQKDPSAIQPLKTAELALNDVASGISTQSVNDVFGKLKAASNPALAEQVKSFMAQASALEQSLLTKYGKTVAGEISIALTKAAAQGLAVGLAGH